MNAIERLTNHTNKTDINIEGIGANFNLISKKLNKNGDIEIQIEHNGEIITLYAKGVISKNENPLFYLDGKGNKIDIKNEDMLKKIRVLYLQASEGSNKYVNSYLRLNSLSPEYKNIVEGLLSN
ncbi:MAG: hypothetical protein PHI37_05050 [Candidatus Gracilibacteria bacterium]|nr:hypothetical protein [Candidatus Gracilibacteria bacterium]